MSQIKDYVKSRMRTEYTDNYKGKQDSARRGKEAAMRESGNLMSSFKKEKKEEEREGDRSFVNTSRSGFLQIETVQVEKGEERK